MQVAKSRQRVGKLKRVAAFAHAEDVENLGGYGSLGPNHQGPITPVGGTVRTEPLKIRGPMPAVKIRAVGFGKISAAQNQHFV